MNSKPSNQNIPLAANFFASAFFARVSTLALILALGSTKLLHSYTSIWVRELNLAQNFSSFVNLILLVPSFEPFFHSNYATSRPEDMSQTIKFFSPWTNFSQVIRKESLGEKIMALIAVCLRMRRCSFPVVQSTTWRPTGSAITASRPANGANFPKVARG